MKPIIFAILLTAVLLPLRADECLTNGDFSNGNHDWYGGTAKTPADFAPPDPFTAVDPFTSKGMIVPLHADWTKECQDFKLKGATTAVLKITYVVSKDFALSTKTEDYSNVTGSIGWNHWVPMQGDPGCFVILISDIQDRHYHYQTVKPELTDKEQTAELVVNGLTADAGLTLALAFPPGKGMIVIKNVSVMGQ